MISLSKLLHSILSWLNVVGRAQWPDIYLDAKGAPHIHSREICMPSQYEPICNAHLADALQNLHPAWCNQLTAELRDKTVDNRAVRIDLLLHPSPLCAPIALETEFAPASTVEADACQRLGLCLQSKPLAIEQVFAVQLDPSLQQVENNWTEVLQRIPYRFCLFRQEKEQTVVRWPKSGWIEVSLVQLAQCLECAVLSPSLLAYGMDLLEQGVREAEGILTNGSTDHILHKLGNILRQKPGQQTTRIAVAILANALNFHTAITQAHQIHTLDQLRLSNQIGYSVNKSAVLQEWTYILDEINYWPIFRLASDLLAPLPDALANAILTKLATVANQLAGIGTTSLHDMAGRMLQQLIVDRKFLATFYTLPNSAVLLAELAVGRMQAKWSSPDTYARLRVADLACGTGTLLSAAYQAMLARYRRTGGDDRTLHQSMMERSLYALDVMPVSTHLAASQLASAHPGTTFQGTQIHTMEYGVNKDTHLPTIGSLELLDGKPKASLFHTHEHILGASQRARIEGRKTEMQGEPHVSIAPGTLHLILMNPPFARDTNHALTDERNPSLAAFNTTAEEQKMMAKRLKHLHSELDRSVKDGNAGLGSNFIDLAEFLITKQGGILGLILPFAFVQGHSWNKARCLLAERYTDITLLSIVTSKAKDRAWSADTDMAEIMLLATRTTIVPERNLG